MKRAIYATLAAVAVASAVVPAAFAAQIGTTTCPTDGTTCVGSGGGAGR